MTDNFSLKYWVIGKRPDDEKGIEVSRSFLEDRLSVLDQRYQESPVSEQRFFLEYQLKQGRLRIVKLTLHADLKPSYLIEIIGSVDEIFDVARRNDLPYSRQEMQTLS